MKKRSLKLQIGVSFYSTCFPSYHDNYVPVYEIYDEAPSDHSFIDTGVRLTRKHHGFENTNS